MKIRRVIRKRIRRQDHGVNVAADVDATVAADVNEAQTRTNVSSRSRSRIVQRSGRRDDAGDERR